MSPRKILHLDLDAFFCAVEELRRPELKGKPFAVGGRPDERGVVASCSYAARQVGVRSAMPMSRALRLCPELHIVPSDHSAYRAASEGVMDTLARHTALIEQLSIDEAFLDLTDLPQTSEELARQLQAEINQEHRLPCSLGAAANKLVAKTATDQAKARHKGGSYPNAILVVPPGEERAFLAPLAVEVLYGVGPKTAERLKRMGVETIGDLARLPEKTLEQKFGVVGRDLAQRARGVDERPVTPERATQSISQEITFDRDVADGERLRQTLLEMSTQVARKLREENLCAGVVRLKLRWPDFTTLSRQVSLDQPADQDGIVAGAARLLFDSVWSVGRPVRLLGVGVSKLSPTAHQLSLWDTPDEKERRLLSALDDLRLRFGDSAVQMGREYRRRKSD